MDAAYRELKSCPAGAGLGLSLHLASLATARHLCSALIKVCKTVAIIEDRKSCYGKEKDILPDRIKIFTEEIAKFNKDIEVNFQISIDDLTEKHNAIRKIKNLFNDCIKSYEIIKKLTNLFCWKYSVYIYIYSIIYA